MIRCKETLSEHVQKYKNPGKAMWAEHSGEQISEGDQLQEQEHIY